MDNSKTLFPELEQNKLIKIIIHYFKTYFDYFPQSEQIDWYLSAIRDGTITLENLEQHFKNNPAHKGSILQKHGCVYTKYGTKMYLHKNDRYISRDIATFYCWEPQESEFLKNYIKKGTSIVDAGANIGYYTLLFSKWTGNQGKVYAFEPEEANYKLLLKNINTNNCSNVVTAQKAISNKTEISSLFLASDGNLGDHRLSDSFDFEPQNRSKVEIHTTTLDSYLSEVQTIDFIKMDIQGSEAKAFEGMADVINRSNKITIFFEFWPYAIEKSGHSPEELIKKILDMGFKIFEIDKGTKKPLTNFELTKKYDAGLIVNLLSEKS